jgi:ribonucleotide reductase beta subunit family protein with ferritin-like domain
MATPLAKMTKIAAQFTNHWNYLNIDMYLDLNYWKRILAQMEQKEVNIISF